MEPSQPANVPNDPASEMAEVIKEFLVESNEGLDRFDRDLIALEKDRNSHELLDSIFRAVHTIKGTGGVLGYEKLVSISHLGESVLSRMRDGVLVLSSEIATALLSMADALRNVLENIAASGDEGSGDYSQLLRELTAVLQAPTAAAPDRNGKTIPQPDEILIHADTCQTDDVHAAVRQQEHGDDRLPGESLVQEGTADPGDVAEGLKIQTDFREAACNTIRVDVGLLDKVMNLVGELVLARNQVLQFTRSPGGQRLSQYGAAPEPDHHRTAGRGNEDPHAAHRQRLEQAARALSAIWRSAAASRWKCEMEGAQTELDKTIIEAIKDPLTHIIRNAVDHGIETPADTVWRPERAAKAACCCAPITRADRSTSRSPTTARASISNS